MTPEERRALLEGLMAERDTLGEGPPDGPWDQLVADRLSAEEEEALRAQAADDPAIALALEGFTPLGDDFQAKILAQVRPAPAPTPAPRRSAWWGLRWALPALAFGAALLLLTPRAPGPLPAYQAEYAGLDAQTRSAPAVESQVLSRDATLQITLRPAERAAGRAEARAWVVRPSSAPAEISTAYANDGGALQLSLRADTMGPPGEAVVVVLVGRDLAGADPEAPPAGVQVHRRAVRLLP